MKYHMKRYWFWFLPILVVALNLFYVYNILSKWTVKPKNPIKKTKERAFNAGVKFDAFPFCDSFSLEELNAIVPVQFYCQGRYHSTGPSSVAAQDAWRQVQGLVPHDLVSKIFKSSKKYESSSLNITLWSTRIDEGASFVLREGAGNTYGLDAHAEPGLAVDIGGNLGAVTIQISRLCPQWQVISVEAMPITFLFLIVNLWLNVPSDMATGRIVPIFAAMGRDGGAATFQFREDSLTSSRDWNPLSESWRTTANFTLPTMSFSSLLRAAGADPEAAVSLLKLDCEGCEYDVVPDLSAAQMAAIHRAVAETHYDGMLKNGRPVPPLGRAELTHARLCRRWRVCIDMRSGVPVPAPPAPPPIHNWIIAALKAAAAAIAGAAAAAAASHCWAGGWQQWRRTALPHGHRDPRTQ